MKKISEKYFQGIPKSGSNDNLQPIPTAMNRVVLFKDGTKIGNTWTGWYTEEQLLDNPNLLFLFGDNDQAKYRTDNGNPGGGGQALVTRPTGKRPYDRLPKDGGVNGNAIGITTTFYDGYTPKIDEFKELMNKEFKPIEDWVKKGGHVVIPCDNNKRPSLGTGIAGLEKNIPGAVQYIQFKVNELITLGQQQIQNSQDLNTLKQELHDALSTERRSYQLSGKLKGIIANGEADISIPNKEVNATLKTKNVALPNSVEAAEENFHVKEKPGTLKPKKEVRFNEQENHVKNIKPAREDFIDHFKSEKPEKAIRELQESLDGLKKAPHRSMNKEIKLRENLIKIKTKEMQNKPKNIQHDKSAIYFTIAVALSALIITAAFLTQTYIILAALIIPAIIGLYGYNEGQKPDSKLQENIEVIKSTVSGIEAVVQVC